MKPVLAKLHKYVALSVGVVLAMMGLTGALLVFKANLEERFYPERRVEQPAGAKPSYESVLRTARAAVPEADAYEINVPADPSRAWNITVEEPEGRRLYIDPYSGILISNRGDAELPLDWIAELHTHLLSGDTGKAIVGSFGGILAFLAVTGVILWWPRRWRDALRVRWGAARLGLNYDLHKAAGAVFAFFLLVSAITGMMMAYSTPVGKFIGTLSGTPLPPPPRVVARDPAQAKRAPLDDVAGAARDALPAASLRRLVVPNGHAPVLARLQAPGDNHPYGQNRIYVDPFDAKVLAIVPLTASPRLRVYDWLYPLHIGRLFGTAHQAFHVVLGLLPAFLLITGLIVWQSRRNARRRAVAATGLAKSG